MGLFLLGVGNRGSKSEICFEDFKTSRSFLFLHFTCYTCIECGKDVCLILQVVQGNRVKLC